MNYKYIIYKVENLNEASVTYLKDAWNLLTKFINDPYSWFMFSWSFTASNQVNLGAFVYFNVFICPDI